LSGVGVDLVDLQFNVFEKDNTIPYYHVEPEMRILIQLKEQLQSWQVNKFVIC
jgi:hypothetical protein